MRSFLSAQIMTLLRVGGGKPSKENRGPDLNVFANYKEKRPVPTQAYHVQNLMPFGKKSVSLSRSEQKVIGEKKKKKNPVHFVIQLRQKNNLQLSPGWLSSPLSCPPRKPA